MRLWTLNPKYLDPIGLVALWREALLAQAVLAGKTVGYRNHPQLTRFKSSPSPQGAVSDYLKYIFREAQTRNYRFDYSRILDYPNFSQIETTESQLLFEWNHLIGKLKIRSPQIAKKWKNIIVPDPHPLFVIVPGKVELWEKSNVKAFGSINYHP